MIGTVINTIYQPVAIFSYIIAIVGIVSVSISIIKANTIKNTVTVLKENNGALQERVQLLEDAIRDNTTKHDTNVKKIMELETQVAYLKTIPLEKISKHMEGTNRSLEVISKLLDQKIK